VRSRRIEAVISWALAEELVEVLGRPKIRRYGITDGDVEDILELLRPMLPHVDVGVEVRDSDDRAVIAAALAGRADAIVSGDRDLLEGAALSAWLGERGVELLTAVELVARLSA
jgi:putative PIN family toxin of toxin-antitoxin system